MQHDAVVVKCNAFIIHFCALFDHRTDTLGPRRSYGDGLEAVSAVTLAALEDTGHYLANYSAAECTKVALHIMDICGTHEQERFPLNLWYFDVFCSIVQQYYL